MALNAFIKIGKAQGEARQGKYGKPGEAWCEVQGWDWEVEAESSWTKGGGASVGKPNPGKFTFEHYYDKASNEILKYISSGEAFDTVTMEMCKGTGNASGNAKSGLAPFFIVEMKQAFITKVSNSATEEGNIVQKVEMVFKSIRIQYAPQGEDASNPGKLAGMTEYNWDIPKGEVW